MEIVVRRPSLVIGIPVLGRFDELGRLVPEAWASAFASLDGTFAEVSTRVGDGYHEVVGVLSELDTNIDGYVHGYVPGGEYVREAHRGERAMIAESFGRIEVWARSRGREVGAVKLDIGYHADGSDLVHELYVGLRPAG
ncbi:hypothetical protein ACWKWP_04670 [Agromyces soli]